MSCKHPQASVRDWSSPVERPKKEASRSSLTWTATAVPSIPAKSTCPPRPLLSPQQSPHLQAHASNPRIDSRAYPPRARDPITEAKQSNTRATHSRHTAQDAGALQPFLNSPFDIPCFQPPPTNVTSRTSSDGALGNVIRKPCSPPL